MRSFEIKMLLEKVLKKLEIIDAKISDIPSVQVQYSSTFLPTINALRALGLASATQVSRVTGRSRAFESKQLNELKAMGIISKQANGRTKVFAVKHDLSAIPCNAPVLETLRQKKIAE